MRFRTILLLLAMCCPLLATRGLAQVPMAYSAFSDSLGSMPVSPPFAKNSTYWLKLAMPDDYQQASNLCIEVGSWGKAVLYSVNEDNTLTEIARTGSLMGMAERSYFSHRNILPVNGKSGANLLLLVQSHQPLFDGNGQRLIVYSEAELQREELIRIMSQSFFFGIIIVMALYNLMIFFSVKDESYIYYVLSILSFGLYFSFYYGFSIEYLWPSAPKWNAHSFALIVPLTNIARVFFTKTYLHTTEYVPTWDRFFNISLAALLVPILLGLGSYWWQWDILPLVVNIIGVLGIVVMMAMMVVSVVVYRQGYRPALWFFVAFVLFNIGGILFNIREMGYLEDNLFTRYAVQIGAIAQVVLFSLGLSSRLNLTRSMLAQEKLENEILKRKQETERKNLIETQRNQLEQKVKERTHELEEALQKVTISEAKLRELNTVKDKLFSIISHDLKTPLTTVASFLDLMMNHLDKLSPEELSTLSSKTKYALQNLTLLLDNLLYWSRMQLDFIAFNPEPVPLNVTIDRTLKLFSLLIEDKSLTITSKIPKSENVAWGDKEMIAFVVRNLLHNALKFTPRSGKISLSTSVHDGMIMLSVQDTGMGMSADRIDHLLSEGGNNSMPGTENEAGTGIGLIMCKEFVERNGGELTIASSPSGTRVSFTVPMYS